MHFNLSDSTDKCGFVVVEFRWLKLLKLFKYIRKGQLFNSTSYTTISISKWLQLKYGLQRLFWKAFSQYAYTTCSQRAMHGFNLVSRIVEDQA